MRKLLKVLSATSLVCIFCVSLCYAETLWEKRQKALKGTEGRQGELIEEESQEQEQVQTAGPIEEISSNLSDLATITIPQQYGSIIETYEGTNGNLIVHIQDAHANYEAQKNIAAIAEYLIKNYNINLILREGASTEKNFAYLREKASLEARRRAAEKLLKNATITGIDYLTLTSNYPMAFQGIEDKALYDANKNALWAMDKFKDAALEYVRKIEKSADSLKQKIYNSELLAMDNAKKDYENETTDLLAYYRILNEFIQKKNISVGEFPNFSALVKIDSLEQKINMTKIGNNTATDEEKALYKDYQEILKNLNINRLFKEEPLVENKIKNAVTENQDQKDLYNISKAVSIMDKMLSVKVVPEEYAYFIENKNDFNAEVWADFLKKKADESGLSLNIPDNYYAVSDNLPIIEKFYSTAGERDKAFIKKSEERINSDNAKTAILIAGGFHTPQLTNLLSEKGYSYIVISPRVITKTDDNLYRQALKND
ncbi:MAG: hypothetical protein Q7O04_04400 [Candidatus Omnitrophota bacterium]|nr:hypothetical protein [Candidatus Omnitrophota bacterium]